MPIAPALAFLMTLLLASPALAECVHSGVAYPEGSRIGVLVCENGEWVLRP